VTISPLSNIVIAMGYANPGLVPGDKLAVDIRGKLYTAEVANWPFYNPDEYGFSRK
jgi:glycine cleavage system aminomethyltransferase T